MGKLGSVLACLLFAVPFGGVGVFATWTIGSTLLEAHRAREWVQVRASVDDASLRASHDSEGGTTYHAEGRYRYEFAGKAYAGSRLGISTLGGADNIDDWQHEVNAKLEDARTAGQPVTVWVNPDNPAESVFDRELRWSQVLFLVPFSLAFGGVGVGALVAMAYVLKGKGGAGGTRQALEGALGTASKPAAAGNKAAPRFLWVFAFFWNAMSWPIAFLAIPDIVENGEWAGLLVLLFPLVGLGLLWAAVAATWSAYRERRGGRSAQPHVPARSAPGGFAAQAARAMFDPQGGAATLRPAATAAVAIPASLAEVEERAGTLTLRYSRRRNLGAGLILLAVGGGFTAVGIGMGVGDGPGVAVVAGIAVGTLLDLWAVSLLASSLVVTVKRHEIAVEKAGLFGRKAWRVRADAVVALKPSISHSVNEIPYFALHAHDRSGERIPVGDGIKGAALADAIASRVAAALGLDAAQVEPAEPLARAPSELGSA